MYIPCFVFLFFVVVCLFSGHRYIYLLCMLIATSVDIILNDGGNEHHYVIRYHNTVGLLRLQDSWVMGGKGFG